MSGTTERSEGTGAGGGGAGRVDGGGKEREKISDALAFRMHGRVEGANAVIAALRDGFTKTREADARLLDAERVMARELRNAAVEEPWDALQGTLLHLAEAAEHRAATMEQVLGARLMAGVETPLRGLTDEMVVPGRMLVADRLVQAERTRKAREEAEKLAAEGKTGDQRRRADVSLMSEEERHAGTERTFRAVGELWEYQRAIDLKDLLRELVRSRLHHHAVALEGWTKAAASIEALDPEDALRDLREEFDLEPQSLAASEKK